MNSYFLKATALFAAVQLYVTPSRSVDGITADLERKLGELETARERKNNEAAASEAKAVVLIRKAIAQRAEAQRAGRVAGRLRELLR